MHERHMSKACADLMPCIPPAGSGKTISAEIAMLRVFTHHPGEKVLYIAPLKALVRERIKDWTPGLCAALGKSMVELTGDYTPDLAALLAADIIICTPEKWDGISRSWQVGCLCVSMNASPWNGGYQVVYLCMLSVATSVELDSCARIVAVALRLHWSDCQHFHVIRICLQSPACESGAPASHIDLAVCKMQARGCVQAVRLTMMRKVYLSAVRSLLIQDASCMCRRAATCVQCGWSSWTRSTSLAQIAAPCSR